jgi:hypothetical protein
MTEQTETNLATALPPVEQIAHWAIERLAIEGYRSSLMSLPRGTLLQLAARLVTPGESRADAHRWLCGMESEEIDQATFYRWCQRFSEVCKTIKAELTAKLLLAELGRGRVDVAQLRELNQHRIQHLVAQELVAAQSVHDIDAARLVKVVSSLRMLDQSERDQESLVIARDDAARRASKAEAEVALLRQRLERIPDQVKELTRRLRQIEDATSQGKRVDPAIFAEIRDALIAMAPPAPGAAPDPGTKSVATEDAESTEGRAA